MDTFESNSENILINFEDTVETANNYLGASSDDSLINSEELLLANGSESDLDEILISRNLELENDLNFGSDTTSEESETNDDESDPLTGENESKNSIEESETNDEESDPLTGENQSENSIEESETNDDESDPLTGENESENSIEDLDNSHVYEALDESEIETSEVEFESGVFTVGEEGEIEVDFLFDGGKYKGELAIFSLEEMDQFQSDSEAFIQEAARRALTDSELGHVVISDPEEGARFSGVLGEHENGDWNRGEHLEDKIFSMNSGDEFGIMFVPNGKVQKVFDNPSVRGSKRPLFSMATANPDDIFEDGLIADLTGCSHSFVMEDVGGLTMITTICCSRYEVQQVM